jgi:hypothetical protein
MKLPHISDPVQRTPIARGDILQPGAGIQPARAATIGGHRVPPPPPVGPGACACTPPARRDRLNVHRPVIPHGCNPGYVPQCDSQGGCNCVPAAQQRSTYGIGGAAVNTVQVKNLMNDLGF